jgi:L-asparaginase / beta-aspartyl-peptidase
MAGAGAMSLADGLPLLEDTTADQRARFDETQKGGGFEPGDYADPEHVDTVGAVGLDGSGGLVAASSTGGVFGKMPGRIGDSSVPGAGTYANAHAAVVGTGVGEAFLETLACFRVADLIERGATPQEATERIVRLIGEERDVAAGLLALSAGGEVGAAFRGGSWSVAGLDGPLDAVKLG